MGGATLLNVNKSSSSIILHYSSVKLIDILLAGEYRFKRTQTESDDISTLIPKGFALHSQPALLQLDVSTAEVPAGTITEKLSYFY